MNACIELIGGPCDGTAASIPIADVEQEITIAIPSRVVPAVEHAKLSTSVRVVVWLAVYVVKPRASALRAWFRGYRAATETRRA